MRTEGRVTKGRNRRKETEGILKPNVSLLKHMLEEALCEKIMVLPG